MKRARPWIIAGTLAVTSLASAQTSSLYVVETAPAAPPPAPTNGNMPPDRLSPAIARMSLSAVRLPEPKRYAVQDFITIIIREATESDSKADLNTKKQETIDGQIGAFPTFTLADLFQGRLKGGDLTNPPKVNISGNKNFKGDGEAKRSDTFTDRITAKIIDVKPNGTMVLEARKFIKSDDETLEMVVTGTCRKEDVTADNTVLSTQLNDLHLTKNHKGALRQNAKKGWLTKLFEGIFAF